MSGFPGNEYPLEILMAAEKTLDSVLCHDSEACGGTDGMRTAAVVDIAKGLMVERHRWFEAIDHHKDHIEVLRRALQRIAANDTAAYVEYSVWVPACSSKVAQEIALKALMEGAAA